jgi:hypothetical protein
MWRWDVKTGRLRQVDGIALNDKVIQVRNRPRSRPMWAYNYKPGKNQKVEVYSGEIGFAMPHPLDRNNLSWAGFRLKRFRVSFSIKRVAEPELLEEIDQSPRQTHEVGSEHGVIEVCDQRVHDGAANGARQHRRLHQ